MNRDNQIREQAYRLWQREGCPAGRHEEHWRQAAREVADPRPSAEGALPGVAEANGAPAGEQKMPGFQPQQTQSRK